MTTERAERMLSSAPSYYQGSRLYQQLQNALAEELNLLEQNDADLQRQLNVLTATWGLRYYEEELGIVTVPTDSYEIRRSRILSKKRSLGNLSIGLIKSVCEAFSGGEVKVTWDRANSTVIIRFVGVRGIPKNLSDLQEQIENIIHAHLGTEYQFTYLTWGELKQAPTTWGDLKAENDGRGITWEEFSVKSPENFAETTALTFSEQ